MPVMKKKSKKTLKMNSNGFTLVEVIVTIVILGILLAGGFVSIISWQHNALYNKNNEYAQTIFSGGTVCSGPYGCGRKSRGTGKLHR